MRPLLRWGQALSDDRVPAVQGSLNSATQSAHPLPMVQADRHPAGHSAEAALARVKWPSHQQVSVEDRATPSWLPDQMRRPFNDQRTMLPAHSPRAMAAVWEPKRHLRLLDRCLFAELDGEAGRSAWQLEAALSQQRDSTATPDFRRKAHPDCRLAEQHLRPRFHRERNWLSKAARWSWPALKLRRELDRAVGRRLERAD